MLSSDELARDVQGAEDMMERHQEIRGEIDTRNEKYAHNVHCHGLYHARLYSYDALINPVCTCTYIVGIVGCNINITILIHLYIVQVI